MPRHQDVRAVGEEEPALDVDAALLEVLDLVEQLFGIDHAAVADDADLVGVEDAGRHEVELEFAQLVDDRVTGVVPGGVPGYDVRFLRKEVDNPPLTLVAPLASDNDNR